MTFTEAEIRFARVANRKPTRWELRALVMLSRRPGMDGPAFGPKYGSALRRLEQFELIQWRVVEGEGGWCKGGWYLNPADE